MPTNCTRRSTSVIEIQAFELYAATANISIPLVLALVVSSPHVEGIPPGPSDHEELLPEGSTARRGAAVRARGLENSCAALASYDSRKIPPATICSCRGTRCCRLEVLVSHLPDGRPYLSSGLVATERLTSHPQRDLTSAAQSRRPLDTKGDHRGCAALSSRSSRAEEGARGKATHGVGGALVRAPESASGSSSQ